MANTAALKERLLKMPDATNFDALDEAAQESQGIQELLDVAQPRFCVQDLSSINNEDLIIVTGTSLNHTEESMK